MEENEYKYMSAWEQFWYGVLFCVPIIGIVILIIFCVDDGYIARRNFARSIILKISFTIVCSILCFKCFPSIVDSLPKYIPFFSPGRDTTERAPLAVFTNNFGQYYDRVTMDALNIKQWLGIKSENVNDAQLNYMVANGLETAVGNSIVENMELPEGYQLPEILSQIYRINKPVVAYVINDNYITGYDNNPATADGSASFEFYGDENGEEYHYITSNNHVFTLPGFPTEKPDGTIQYYISNEKGAYYIIKGTSSLNIGDTNIEGNIVVSDRPVTHEDLINAGTYKIGG